MGGSSNYQYPVALNWDRGPEHLRRLKNKLELYFGSKSKSDGGECEIRDSDCSRGYILIYFKEEAVRDRILQRKTHELKLPGGQTLQLIVQSPDKGSAPSEDAKTPPPRQEVPAESDREVHQSPDGQETPTREDDEVTQCPMSSLVLIENIQKTCTPEILNLLVENISEKEENIVFYVERIPETQSAVISFTSDNDVGDFIAKFSVSPRVKQQNLRAKRLEETRSIRVEGLPTYTSEDILDLYFESTKHGGGTIERKEMLLEEGAAIITFATAEVVKTVQTKQHRFGNSPLSIYPYYPSIGQWLFGKEEKHIVTPVPVEHPISAQILEFISNNGDITLNIEQHMTDHYCDVKWPDPGCTKPVITLSFPRDLSEHRRTLTKIAPTWSNKVSAEISLLMSKYKVTEFDLKPKVWEAIREKVSASPYDGVLIKSDLAAEKVFIVGVLEDVTKIEPIFRKLVEETTRQLSAVEDNVALEPAAFRLLSAHGLEKNIQEDSPHVKMSYDGATKTIKLYGPKDEVLNAKCVILKTKQNLKSKSIDHDPHVIQFLMAADNEELSCNLLMIKGIKALFQVKDNTVVLIGYSDEDLKNAEQTLRKELVCKQISVEDKSVTRSTQWESLKSFLNETFNVGGLKVSIEELPARDGTEVAIIGLSSPAEETYQQIHAFVQTNTPMQKDIKLKSMATLQFLEEERNQEWNRILRNVKIVKKQNCISLCGLKIYVEEAESYVTSMESTLHYDTLNIDKPGAKKFCIDNEDMHVGAAKNTVGCMIYFQKDGDDRISGHPPKQSELLCQLNLHNEVKLTIYKGDLCQHHADVIIIASNKNLNPAGGPALALLKAAGPEVKKECECSIQKDGSLEPGEHAITNAGNLPCKKLIHACSPDNNAKCERLLRKVITDSLVAAAENGLGSAAISVSSFVFSGIPLETSVENIPKAVKLYTENQKEAIKKIHLVDNDDHILTALTKFLKESMVVTKEGVHVNVIQGNIEDTTDSGASLTAQPPAAEATSNRTPNITRDPSSSVVLIQNLRDSYSNEMLNLLVENISEKSEDTDFNVERIPDIQSAVITFTCNIDIVNFVEKFSRHPRVQTSNMTAKLLEETRTIRVEGLPPNTCEDYISLYFENPKHGVPGSTEDVLAISDEGAAMVTFSSVEAAKIILGKKHQFGKKEVSVFPYYPSQDIVLYGKQRPQILKSEPLTYDVPRKEIRLSGLKEEVLTAKCEILNIKQEMKCKSIQINPHLVQFLRSTDNEELSGLLFVRHNINALLEIDNDSVKLTAHSTKDLTEAEEQINQELLCIQIFVKEMSVLRSPEWRSLYSYLLETFNAQKSTILVLESPSGAKNHLVIAGLSSNVQKCHQNVNDFLDKNTPMEKNIKVKKLVVLQFFREEKKQVLDELKNAKLSVAIRNKNICLKGPKVYVTKAYSRVSDVLGSLYSDTLCIDKPGAKKLYLSNEDLYVTMSKKKFRCLLRLQKEEDEETAEDEDEEMEEPQCRVTLPNGAVISVHKGDLCRLNVDVVVNAANEDLKHVGGLALALLKSAGQTLQDDSDDIIKTEGRLSAGESVITASGRLPCKQVIHTVWPRWNSTSSTQCERLLQKAITSSLELAEEYCHSSIAIPAISLGIFGCPVDKSAENIVKAIKRYMDGKPKGSSTIKEVHLVDINENTVRIFASSLKKVFGEEEAEPSPKCREKRAERMEKIVPKEKVYKPKVSANQMMTKENIVIGIREGFIQDATTDVIVNSVGKDLQLSGGKVSQALLNKAGNRLQQYLRDVSSGVQVDEGSVLITDGCNLACKAVIHVVVPQWNGKGSSEKIFRDVVTSCLCESEKNKRRSITFPAIGTGAPGFPKRAVASFMFEEILKFSSKVKPQHLREVTFILHPSDRETLMEFSKELSSQMDNGATVRPCNDISSPGTSQSSQVVAASGPGFFGTVSSPMAGTYEIKVGSVTYQVKSGDITKEDTDIIVNSTNGTFTMRSGVSGAILSAAGQSVVDECTRLGSQNDKEYIVTQSGNLRCKKILHKIGTNSAGGIKTFICEALAVCAQLQATSVAFPAIGTGMGNVSASAVADSILESVADFGSSSQSVQTVKVVIFQTQMLNDFHSSMKKKEGGPRQEGIFSKVKKSFFENVKSPAQDVYEMKIGSVTYQVKTGDITKETCDVIINSTNSTFNLKTGVSKAILEAAGPNIENECAMLGTRPNKGYVVTQGGNLHCKNIIHVVSQTKPHLIGQCVTTALYECEKQQATSVAFPAMGTGSGSVPSAAVANAMIDAVVDFLKSKSIVTVQNVTVVIFQPQMLTDFHDSMKKKEPPAPPKHWFSWFKMPSFSSSQSDKSNVVEDEEEEEEEPKVFELRENIEPAIIHLCAESRESVKAASDWLREMITKDQRDNTITDDFIQYLHKKDQDVLAQLQRENRVHLILDSQWSTIKVEGRTKDVLEVSNKIQDIIKDIRDKKTREHEAELCSNVVEWGYYQGTNFIPFDKMTNLELEKAKNDDLSCLNIDINGVKYTVIIELKSARDPKGNTITLQRNPKNAESLLIPPYWDAMDNTQLKVVPLNASSPDYSEVQDLFTKTCQMRIIKIERIQNKPLYQNYQIKKDSIDAKNRSKTNEERLFHGTDIETTKNINGNGFNRAYAGSNATKLGKGTYFAVEAIYSADDTYSKPDANAYKYMYLARVLTGVSCVGNSSMIAPPAKSTSNPTDLYDSVTDSVSAPTVFVIFSDIQAYPEYLITFTK